MALVRDPQKAVELVTPGVSLLQGSYDDPALLVAAFQGVSTVLLISETDLATRTQQHRHAIDAARAASATRLVYTSGVNPSAESAFSAFPSHAATEDYLRASGLTYTILRNTLYLDLLPMLIDPGARARGTFYYAAGSGQASFSLRAEIAEVLATVLTTPGHANQTYDIAPGPVHTMDEVTAAISAATGQPLYRMPISDEELAVALHQHHLPEPLITLTPTHPLLAVIDLAEYPLAEFPAKSALRHLYLVVLKRHFYGELPYGQRVYDYRQGVLGFYAPGQP